jgi:SAM-dependent methyltransferase
VKLHIEQPWIVLPDEEKYFYHSFLLNEGEVIYGDWDISEDFFGYIGNTDLLGKRVLDVGTASGFLAFSAEERGASDVVAIDIPSLAAENRVPFKDFEYSQNKIAWANKYAPYIARARKGFWYVWHKKKSKVRVSYCTIEDLLSVEEQFDIVLAGAIIEHLADPISALGAFCRLAKETVVVAFTPLAQEAGEYMKPLIPWDHSDLSYVWWVLSKDLYDRIFFNLGFKPEYRPSRAVRLGPNGERTVEHRTTIVARRID